MMEMVKQAEASIGEHQSDDWSIQPRGFSEHLQNQNPDLASFLSDSQFMETAKRYENADHLAVDYQQRFKKRARNTTIAIFCGAVATAALSIISADPMTPMMNKLGIHSFDMPGLVKDSFSFIAGLVVFVASGVAVFNSQIGSQLKLYDQWMENRAKAETARLVYFHSAAKRLIDECRENRQLLHEYCCFFRRYQLQVQQNYYGGRSQQHADSLRKTVKLSAVAAVIVAAFSGSAGMAGAFDQAMMSFAALGTIGVALSALASHQESINQDERNALRYKITADVLSKVAEKYSGVQKAIATGKDPVILLHFVGAVHEQLSLEHRQWTEDAAEINTAFADLTAAEEG